MILVVVIVFLLLFVLIGFFVRSGVPKRILYSYCSFWFFTVFLSNLNLYGLYAVSDFVNMCIILYVSSGILGYIFVDLILHRMTNKRSSIIRGAKSAIGYHFFVKSKRMNLCYVFCVVVVIYVFDNFLTILLLSSFRDVHAIRYTMDFYNGNVYLGLLFSYLVVPISFFSLFVIISGLLFKKKECLILPVVVSLFFIVLNMAKGPLLYILFFLVFIFFYRNNKSVWYVLEVNKMTVNKNYLFMFILVAVSVVYIISILRSGDDLDFLRMINTYLVGPFRALDYAINDISMMNSLGYPKCGYAMFAGLDEVVYLFSSLLYKPENISFGRFILSYLQDSTVSVGLSSGDFNFAFSTILFCYLDFGLLGVVCYPFFISGFFCYLLYKFEMHPSFPLFALVAYLYYVQMSSFFSWEYAQTYSWFYMFMLLFMHIFKRNKIC